MDVKPTVGSQSFVSMEVEVEVEVDVDVEVDVAVESVCASPLSLGSPHPSAKTIEYFAYFLSIGEVSILINLWGIVTEDRPEDIIFFCRA